MKPQPGEIVQDPAAGTGGFLIAADRYIKERTDDLYNLTEQAAQFQRNKAFFGMEQVPDAHRLADEPDAPRHRRRPAILGDTLSPEAQAAQGRRHPDQPAVRHQEGRRLAHARRLHLPDQQQAALPSCSTSTAALKPGGRAAVVLPDNVLFEDGTGTQIRADLMDKCDLHTILRLPTGIFYAQGVKTNVLFFTRGETDKGNTKEVWVYDLRTNMPAFGKRTPLTREHFAGFETWLR